MPLDGDMHEFTIMSYRSAFDFEPGETLTNSFFSGFPQTLMMYDIAAIQQLYGANFLSNHTDTTYTFDTETGRMFVNGIGQVQESNVIFRTIWDGNGVDTYDFSNFETNLNVDLAPGGWSDLDTESNQYAARLFGTGGADTVYARGQIFNALQYQGDERSLIENAVGGSGDDVIRGNQADNTLTGNDGNDLMYGYEGDDTFRYLEGQGAGAGELADGGAGYDTLQIVTSLDHATFNFVGADFVSIEEIEFTTDIFPIFDATAIFEAGEFDGNPTTEFAPDLHVVGNAMDYSAEDHPHRKWAASPISTSAPGRSRTGAPAATALSSTVTAAARRSAVPFGMTSFAAEAATTRLLVRLATTGWMAVRTMTPWPAASVTTPMSSAAPATSSWNWPSKEPTRSSR